MTEMELKGNEGKRVGRANGRAERGIGEIPKMRESTKQKNYNE